MSCPAPFVLAPMTSLLLPSTSATCTITSHPSRWKLPGFSDPSNTSGKVQPHADVQGHPSQNQEKLLWTQCDLVARQCHKAKSVARLHHIVDCFGIGGGGGFTQLSWWALGGCCYLLVGARWLLIFPLNGDRDFLVAPRGGDPSVLDANYPPN